MSSSSSARCASSALRRRHCQIALTASASAISAVPASAQRSHGGSARTKLGPPRPPRRAGIDGGSAAAAGSFAGAATRAATGRVKTVGAPERSAERPAPRDRSVCRRGPAAVVGADERSGARAVVAGGGPGRARRGR